MPEFIIMQSLNEPHNPPEVTGEVLGAIRLWIDGVPSDRWIMVLNTWDGVAGSNIKLADLTKFSVEIDKILTAAKFAMSDFGLTKRRNFRMDLKIPSGWLNGYTK